MLQDKGSEQWENENRLGKEGGREDRIALAQGRSEWRQEGYQSRSDGKWPWMLKPLPGHGAEKGSKGKLMSKGKKMKEEGEERRRRRK